MPQSNLAKWKNFADGAILYGPSGVGQNLNLDLQQNLADEVDSIVQESMGDGVCSGMAVSSGAGLSVDIALGVAYASGQRVRTTGTTNLGGLTASATLKIFVSAGGGYVSANHAWPASYGFTAGSLSAGQVLLATITTNGVGVTGVTDGRSLLETKPAMYSAPDDTATPAAAALSMFSRLSMLAAQIKAVTGKAAWYTAPDATIATIWGKFNASTGHGHTGTLNDGPVLVQASTHASPDTDAAAGSLHHTLGDNAGQAQKGGHVHSGAAGEGVKLAQANTHQSADTDTATSALHHTLGTGANQAAAGNHGHAASAITNTAAGGIAATDVQAAINELDTEKVAIAGDTMTGDLKVKKSTPAVRLIGTEGSAKDYQIIEDTGVIKVQQNTGTEGTPVWKTILSVDQAGLVTLVDGYDVRTAMKQPPSPTLTPATTGGTLATGTYYYQIVGVDAAGNLSAGGVENSTAVTGPTGKVTLAWTHVPGAISYRIYRGTTPGGENKRYTSTTNSFVDTNAAATTESPSATNAAWANFIAADGNSWIAGNKQGVVKNLWIAHQLRADVYPDARIVVPVGSNKYAT